MATNQTQYRLCAEVKPNGEKCQSPALKDKSRCYYHHRDFQRRQVLAEARGVKQFDQTSKAGEEVYEALDLPSYEDPSGIQIALHNIGRMLLAGHIERADAMALFFSLQIAAMNSRHTRFHPSTTVFPVALEDPAPIRSLGHPSLEADEAPGFPQLHQQGAKFKS